MSIILEGKNGKQLSAELAVMSELAAQQKGTVADSAPVELLDWYDLNNELILVLERPVPCQDLFEYCSEKGGYLDEAEAKVSCFCVWMHACML